MRKGGACMLGNKLSAVTAPCALLHQTPALARALIKTSLHCTPSLCAPPLCQGGSFSQVKVNVVKGFIYKHCQKEKKFARIKSNQRRNDKHETVLCILHKSVLYFSTVPGLSF